MLMPKALALMTRRRLHWICRFILRLRKDESGSGTAIGIAILFPVLMLLIMSLQSLIDASFSGQVLSRTANRVARTASLCCHTTKQVETVVKTSLIEAERIHSQKGIYCTNDLAADSDLLILDTNEQETPVHQDQAVPSGGTVFVLARCHLSAGFIGLKVWQSPVGSAIIDPYRARRG